MAGSVSFDATGGRREYGVATELSSGQLFIAGFGPGLQIGVALMLFVYLYCRWKG